MQPLHPLGGFVRVHLQQQEQEKLRAGRVFPAAAAAADAAVTTLGRTRYPQQFDPPALDNRQENLTRYQAENLVLLWQYRYKDSPVLALPSPSIIHLPR